MEKTKYFETLTQAINFCLANGIFVFYFKKQGNGTELHYWEQSAKTFVCEICGCITPVECEGADPNTCADCNPIRVDIDYKGEL